MKTYFTPGPSQTYPKLKEYINSAFESDILSISHRSSQFSDIYMQVVKSMKFLLDIPEDYQIYFLGSATECMERTIQNAVMTNCTHLVNGAFSSKFADIAQANHKSVQIIEKYGEENFSTSDIHSIDKRTELIAITQNESSEGKYFPESLVRQIKEEYPESLIALDVVSSIPYYPIDFSILDYVFFSVQKNFGLPAGMGVMIVSPRAMEKAKSLESNSYTGSFHSIYEMGRKYTQFQTVETPNVLNIYLLMQVLEDLQARTLTGIREEIDSKYQIISDFLQRSDKIGFYVQDELHRSKTIIVCDILDDPQKLHKYLTDHNYAIGSGYKEKKSTQVRIANFLTTDLSQTERLLELIQESLK